MSVKVRERFYRETHTMTWQADIHVRLLDGRKIRERSKVPGATSRSGALKWAQERERWLILHGHENGDEHEPEAPTVPTLAAFGQRFIAEYAVANRLKPSTIENKKMILRNYLVPSLGGHPLDAIREADVQRLKASLSHQAAGSVNNILTLLSTMLKAAVEWGVIEEVPRIRKLKRQDQRFDYYDEEAYQRLVAAARVVDPRSLLVVLLAGEAGLRGGEILALRLAHCDLRRGVLHVVENDWNGHVGSPKSNRNRRVVMTSTLKEALRERARESSGDARVLLRDDGTPATRSAMEHLLRKAQTAAGLPHKGPHILRHTFCSRLAARGAAPRAIQELAGHLHSSTTDRYLHLAPDALRTAVDLLDSPRPGPVTSARALQ